MIADSELHEYYRYGDDAVTTLVVVAEYIFNRNGYKSIQPKTVKEYLGQEDEEESDEN